MNWGGRRLRKLPVNVRIRAVVAGGGLLSHFLAVKRRGQVFKVGEGADGGEVFPVFVEGEGAGGDFSLGADEQVKTSGGAIQDREFFPVGGGGNPFEVAGGKDEVRAGVPDRFLNPVGDLREALNLFDRQTMIGVELWPVTPAQLVEGNFLHTPPGKLNAQVWKCVKVLFHQNGVDPQFEIGGLIFEPVDSGFHFFKKPRFAAHQVMERGKPVYADGQLGVISPDVLSDGRVGELGAVGRRAEMQGVGLV